MAWIIRKGEGNSRPQSVNQKSLLYKHNKAGNKCNLNGINTVQTKSKDVKKLQNGKRDFNIVTLINNNLKMFYMYQNLKTNYIL